MGAGLVAGAGYIDVHFVLPALWVMIAASVVMVLVVLAGAYRNRLRLVLLGLGAYAAVAIVGLYLVPGMVQSFRVEPNELQLETPYLLHNIELTRAAYGLDRVREEPYAAGTDLTLRQLADNRETIQNIRLWDPRLLIQTFRQLQEIRQYYQFYDVDIDRYTIDGKIRQVVPSTVSSVAPFSARSRMPW